MRQCVSLFTLATIACLFLLARRIGDAAVASSSSGHQRRGVIVVPIPDDSPHFGSTNGKRVHLAPMVAHDEDTGATMVIKFVPRAKRATEAPALLEAAASKEETDPQALNAGSGSGTSVAPHSAPVARPPPRRYRMRSEVASAATSAAHEGAGAAPIIRNAIARAAPRVADAVDGSVPFGADAVSKVQQYAGDGAAVSAVGVDGAAFGRALPRDPLSLEITDGRGCRLRRPPERPTELSPRVKLEHLDIRRPCVIVTAIFGDIERTSKYVANQRHGDEHHHCAKVLFTDRDDLAATNSLSHWQIVRTPFHLSDPRISPSDISFRKAKWYKMNFFRLLPSRVVFAVWIDGTVAITSPDAVTWIMRRMMTEVVQPTAAPSPLDGDEASAPATPAEPSNNTAAAGERAENGREAAGTTQRHRMASIAVLHHPNPGAWFEVLSSVDKYGFGLLTFPTMVVEYATAVVREGFCEGPVLQATPQKARGGEAPKGSKKQKTKEPEDPMRMRRVTSQQLAAMLDYGFMMQCPSHYKFERLLYPMHSPKAKLRDFATRKSAANIAATLLSTIAELPCGNNSGKSLLLSARPLPNAWAKSPLDLLDGPRNDHHDDAVSGEAAVPASDGRPNSSKKRSAGRPNNRLMYTTAIVAFDMRNSDVHAFLEDWYERSVSHLQDQVALMMSLWKFGVDPVVLNSPSDSESAAEFEAQFRLFPHGK